MPTNTGVKRYTLLRQYDSATGLPTGVTKANTVGDPDYVPDVIDYVHCPITSWQPAFPFCVTVSGVNTGYRGYASRIRLINSIPDGYSEANTNGGGLGPYFPPYLDEETCPIPDTPPPPPPIPPPSLTLTSNTVSAGKRTQVFQVGSSVNVGNKFYVEVYSHHVEIVAVAGDTPASIATKLKNAVNATTATQWNDHASAPAPGTLGFKPTATSSSNIITLVLDQGHQFAGNALVS